MEGLRFTIPWFGGGSNDIVVDPGYLESLAQQYADIAEMLRTVQYTPNELASAPEVAAAYGEFEQKWDRTRGEVAEGVDYVVDALREVSAAFQDADSRLAEALRHVGAEMTSGGAQ